MSKIILTICILVFNLAFTHAQFVLNLDGDDDYIDLGISDLGESFTFEVSCKVDDHVPGQGGYQYILTKSDNSKKISFTLGYDYLERFFITTKNKSTGTRTALYSKLKIEKEVWYHLAVTYGETGLILYVNGVFDSKDPRPNLIGKSDIPYVLGSMYGNIGNWNGGLDEMRIWDHARGADQINAFKDTILTGKEQGLIAYYDFDQGKPEGNNLKETTLKNRVKKGIDGTLYNFALEGLKSNWVKKPKLESDNLETYQVNSYEISIHPNKRIVSLSLPPSKFDRLFQVESGPVTALYRETTKAIYEVFEDDFDFIFYFTNNAKSIKTNLGFGARYYVVHRDFEGTGHDNIDLRSAYGSSNKLKGVIQFNQFKHFEDGPVLHELMHHWANKAISTIDIGDNIKDLGGTLGPRMLKSFSSDAIGDHWGFTGANVPAQLGGFVQSSLEEVGPNTYQTKFFKTSTRMDIRNVYSEMELYLMGMIPISKVSDFDVFTKIKSIKQVRGGLEFNALQRKTYTPSRLEKELGPRKPSYKEAQKDFKVLMVVLTENPLTDVDWRSIDNQSERFEKRGENGLEVPNFWEATGGRGTMEFGNLNPKR